MTALTASLFFASRLFMQEVDTVRSPTVERDEIDRHESLFDQIQTESDDLQLIDELTWRQEHPFDLNSISQEELESLPGVTPAEASSFISFRRHAGRFVSVEQLRVIEGVGEGLYEKIKPFVEVSGGARGMGIELRSRTSRDLQPRRGFLDSSFIGSSVKSYNRLLLEAGEVQVGAVFEKDGGERFSDGFVSGYAAVKDLGFVSHVVVGDFTADAGQGLVLWRSSAFGKGSEAVSVAKKTGLGIRPYRSTDEFNFLRGVAASSALDLLDGNLAVTAFFSRRSLAGSTDITDALMGLYEEGFFRTQNELQKQKAVTEQLFGGRIQFAAAGGWSIGATAYHSRFDKPFLSDRVFEFSGQTATVAGVDGGVQFERLTLFGEVANSGAGAVAGLA
ncbi:MAG: helix-hairpin-helix domain-containing protein, partial [Bacteroidota bacterium]